MKAYHIAMETYFPSYAIKVNFNDWLTAFEQLSKALDKKKKVGKKVIFLDELPWLATKKSDFLSALSWFWNSWAVKKKVVLIICGSAASWMISNVIGDKGGLHNRVTKLLKVDPFNLYETSLFLKSKGINLSQYQMAQIYMTIGGVPMYLDFLKPGLTAVQNIQMLCFDQNGFLRNEFNRLFVSLFDNHHNHVNIVEVLAQKKAGMTRQEIIARGNMTNGGMLTKVLNELKLAGFIDEYSAIEKIEKNTIFRLVDPYTLFFLTFMKDKTKTNKFTLTNFSDLPSWKPWSGYAFENLCIYHIDHVKAALSIKGMTTSIASFAAKPKDGMPGAQIDLLINRNDQSINVCEMKFSSNAYALTKSDIQNIDKKKQVLSYHLKSKKHLFTTLITTHAIAKNAYSQDIDQLVLLEHLFVN